MEKKILNPKGVHPPVGAYSHSIRTKGEEILFIAGQGGMDEEGRIVGKWDIRAQTRQALENIKRILEAHGVTFENVVKMNTYVTDIEAFRNMKPNPREEYIKKDFPASTLVEIKRLALEDMLVEIEAIAVI